MDSIISLVALGQQIRKRRKEKNYSREQLAELMGVSPATIKDLERGTNTNPTLNTLKAICKCLDCSPNYLFGIDEHPTVAHAGIAKLTGLSDLAIDKLLNLSPVEKGFCNALFSGSDLFTISNKFQAFRIVLNTPKALIAEHPNSPLQANLNGMELPKVAIKDAEDYTRFELSRAFINFAERGIKK